MTSKKTLAFADVSLGQALPELVVPITVTLINGGAIATRDYFPGHHDKEAAQALGSPHIFMNILTTTGLVQRYVQEWAGPLAALNDLRIKLGAPNYPGDSMTFSAQVSEMDESAKRVTLSLKGTNSMGNHVTGTVNLVLH
ncbi:MaoC family dehydratase [Pseudomonas sp. R5(2019)]|uniref:MaoC family dehydratase n=1 Tax=Pseudomonas sp. R5(2019) TaxID=2697566 RepID=UPI0014129DDB|nr:MaoC family dehydratase [Pseudomonas sp. R5(2019)]NBA98302.1 acyl dehydratase [Pseudomonas sp. R5(2019)]